MREILNQEAETFMSISCSLCLLTNDFNHAFVAIVLDRNGCSGVMVPILDQVAFSDLNLGLLLTHGREWKRGGRRNQSERENMQTFLIW